MVLLLSILVIFLQLGFLIVVLYAILIFVVVGITITSDVPYVRTPRRYYIKIEKALDLKGGDYFFELGSGDSGLMLWLAKRHPDCSFVGIELNSFLYTYARLRLKLSQRRNVQLFNMNFYDADFTLATVFYLYLLPKVLDRLDEKIVTEAPRARITSRAFQFETRKPALKVQLSKIPGLHGENMLYIYKPTE